MIFFLKLSDFEASVNDRKAGVSTCRIPVHKKLDEIIVEVVIDCNL